MTIQRKRVAKRLASGLLAGALALGGLALSSGSVSAKTPTSLTTMRLAGADRYETAIAVARDLAAQAGSPTGLVVASGENPYDALAGSVLTTSTRPMVLVRKDSVPTAVSNFIADYRTSFRDAAASVIYVLGGESAVSADVVTAITTAVTSTGDLTPPTVVRISGADRYATAKAISDVAGITVASDRIIIVNGENGKWADALSAGLLSAENGWPIVLTTSTGIQASAKAKIDSYLALGGSQMLFTIVGGTSVVPADVTDYLVVENGVPPANITRYGGADRYATNQAVNKASALYGVGTRYVNNALVSGESPWDALAASAWAAYRNSTLLMTPAASLNAGLQVVAYTGSVYDALGYGGNANLWVIGGQSAVSEIPKLTFVGAAASANLTSTLECDSKQSNSAIQGYPTATLTLSGAISDVEDGYITTVVAGQVLEGTAAVTHTVGDLVGVTNVANTVYSVSLPANTTVGSTITWSGWTEGVAVGANTPTRSIAGSSCVYGNDSVAPSVSLRALPATDQVTGTTTSAGLRLLLSSDEAVAVSTATNFVSLGALSVTSSVTATDVSPGGAKTLWLLQLATTAVLPPSAVLTAGGTVTLQAANITDAAGNTPAASPTATIAADSTAPTIGTPSVSVSAVSQAVIAKAPLKFTAKDDSATGGALYGARANSWQLDVNNVRGTVLPTVSIDSSTKTITVTADTGYHTVADIVNAYAATGDGNWTVGATTGDTTDVIAATVANATVLTADGTAGVSNVRIRVTASEPVILTNAGVSVNVSDLIAGTIGTIAVTTSGTHAAGTNSNLRRQRVQLDFTSTSIGTGTLTFLANATGMYDISGNRFSGSVNFTVS